MTRMTLYYALSIQKQIVEICVAEDPSKKSLDVAVDGFHRTEAYFGAAVVQNPAQVIDQHVGAFLKGSQPLPSQFIESALQIALRVNEKCSPANFAVRAKPRMPKTIQDSWPPKPL